jgi:hypothetical protein
MAWGDGLMFTMLYKRSPIPWAREREDITILGAILLMRQDDPPPGCVERLEHACDADRWTKRSEL